MTDTRACRVVAVCIIAFGAACIVAAITALASMGTIYGVLPGAGEVAAYLYQINAFFCAFAVMFSCAVLSRGEARRRNVLLVAAWALLILSVMYYTPFITDSVSYLAAMEFIAALRYLSAYLPFMAVVAALVALITVWNSTSHRAAGITAMACSLVSVFASVIYLWQVIPSVLESDTMFDSAQMLAIILGYVTVTLVCLECWLGTASDDVFAEVFGGADQDEAVITALLRQTDAEGRRKIREQIEATALPASALLSEIESISVVDGVSPRVEAIVNSVDVEPTVDETPPFVDITSVGGEQDSAEHTSGTSACAGDTAAYQPDRDDRQEVSLSQVSAELHERKNAEPDSTGE